MHNAVLDRPVAPLEWVNETHTRGSSSGNGIGAQRLDLSVYELFLQYPWRLTGSSCTESLHVVAESWYVAQPGMTCEMHFHDLDSIRARLFEAMSGSEPPPMLVGRDTTPHSPALQAAIDLKAWLHLTYDEVATISGLAKRTIHHWQATGAQPRPTTIRRLLEVHALVSAVRKRLQPDRAGDWFRTGAPTPLQLLQTGDWSSVQEAAQAVLFRRPQEHNAAGQYSSGATTELGVDTLGMFAGLEQTFNLDDRVAVVSFLGEHPTIAPKLPDLAVLISEYFAGAPLYLRVVNTAPTGDAPDGRRLLLFISTDVGEESAMAQMDRLMTAWQPDLRPSTHGAFSVDLAFGTTASDVEVAVQRFKQSHGAGHKRYRDLAQRLLNSKPGSAEEGSARADLAASLASDEETSPPNSRVDALGTLARLRRQASKQ